MNKAIEIFATILENAKRGIPTYISTDDRMYIDDVERKLNEHLSTVKEQFDLGYHTDSNRRILLRQIEAMYRTLINLRM